ncbi:MAG: hypothetical protein JWQ09_682 [Segetibacter sp.]|nr:hypothetical protein [Segetibacter sp.]
MKHLTIILSILILTSFRQDKAIKVFGFYSNEKSSDGEHSKGYILNLWNYKGSFIGTMSYNEGLIGDQTTEIIRDVKYNKTNGNFSFTSLIGDEKVQFAGKIFPTKVTGTFTWSKRVDRNQSLKSCCKDAVIHKDYETFQIWEKTLKELQ